MFGQTFDPGDVAVVAMLVVLEATLSIDNALVLGMLARRAPAGARSKALSYGLLIALFFRIVAAALAGYLLHWSALKLVGGVYLLWVALRLFLARARRQGRRHSMDLPAAAGLWQTIVAIELTDLAFAADSILAAVALIGPAPAGAIHPKLWVVVAGGMIGVIVMRFAAAVFSRLMERFPRLDRSACLLVAVIGIKLVLDWAVNSPAAPRRLDFSDPRGAAMWVFWAAMVGSIVAGLAPGRGKE